MFARRIKMFGLALCCFGATGLYAHADTITDLGSTYNLTYAPGTAANTYSVMLTIDTQGFTNTSTDTLNAVALVLATSNGGTVSASEASLTSGPTGFGATQAGGLSASNSGCDGSGASFFCVGSSTGVPVAHAGDVYPFDFLITLPAGVTLSTAHNADHVKAIYVALSGKSNGITSEDITLSKLDPVPEPSSMLLLATGMLGFAAMFRRQIFSN